MSAQFPLMVVVALRRLSHAAGPALRVLVLVTALVTCVSGRAALAGPADAPAAGDAVSLAAVQAANKALEEEIARLKPLLDAEPCAIAKALALPAATPAPTAAAVPPGTGNAEQDAAAFEAATVLILVPEPTASMGTGFFVTPDIVVTNHHVAGNSTEVAVISKGLTRPLPGKVIAATDQDGRDYAIIRVDAQQATAKPLPLCGTIHKTEKVGTWGFPGTLSLEDPKFKNLMNGDLTSVPEAVYSEGVVNVVHETTPPEILHTAVTSHGNSGGPLLNAKGCVIGINTYIVEDEKSYRQTSVALGAGDLAAYLRSQGIQVSFSR